MTYIKNVLSSNSCVKPDEVGANLVESKHVEEILFWSDRESIIIFKTLTPYSFLKLLSEAKNKPSKQQKTPKGKEHKS